MMKPCRLSILVLGILVVAALLGLPAEAARDFPASASNYLKTTSFTVSDAPFTVALDARLDTTAGTQTLWAMTDGNAGVAEDGWLITALASNVVRGQVIQGGTASNAATTNTVTDGTWFHVVYIETATNSRTCILNGDTANAGTSTTGRNPANPIEFTLGGQGNTGGTGLSNPIDGALQRVAFWNVALTTDQAVQLSRGVDPRTVARGSLVGYWPIAESSGNAPGVLGGPLTLTGTLAGIGGPTRAGMR